MRGESECDECDKCGNVKMKLTNSKLKIENWLLNI